MRLDNIIKSYGSTRVLDGFSAEFENGAVTWITGESGAGKTTLLRIIAGLEDFEGTISDKPSDRISMVFQEDRLFEELTPLGNCLLAAEGQPPFDISEALMSSGLDKDEINRPASRLSGGQKRRTAIIRALVPNAGIILMDEPFKGLDEENKLRTADVIKRCAAGKTIIASTHDPKAPELIAGKIMHIE